jgi:hypothetical protein
VSHGFHRLFSLQTVIAARCDRCGKLVAVYEEDTACSECETTGGVWRPEGRCKCGTPELPGGSELAKLVARARRKLRGPGERAPVKVRVTCGSAPGSM